MNRSIFQIWKQKTIKLNYKPKKNFTFFKILGFKYLETSKYSFSSNETTNLDKNFYFRSKFENHYNSKFTINLDKISVNNLSKIKEINTTNPCYDYLTLNTSKKDSKTSEYIGKVFHRNGLSDQFLNYNYQTITDPETDKLLIKTNNPKELLKANELENLLIDSDKISIVEKRLNNNIPILEESLNKGVEFFQNCIKNAQHINDCYQILIIKYGPEAKIISSIFFKNFGV